jgi:hypothetical protein
MKSRCGNIAFYKWFLDTVFRTAVSDTERFYNYEENSPAYLQLDGEPIQLKCFEDPEILDQLRNKNIDIGKSFFSGTSIVQPADVGNLFRGSKKAAKSLKDPHVVNGVTFKEVQAAFASHNKKQKDAGRSGLTQHHNSMGPKGVVRVQLALQNAACKNTIVKSFAKAGVFPYKLDDILKLRRGDKISTLQKSLITTAMPIWGTRYAAQGELFESDFDEFEIPVDAKKVTVPRDKRVVYQRRSVLLTHREVWIREAKKKSDKEDAVVTRQAKRKATEEKRAAVAAAKKRPRVTAPIEDGASSSTAAI